ncbi:MAG: hypothetical protein IJ056_06505 [Acidaminococcaceae bacterium]|nr:hypothetical protein [Acidaminococcaceae bacterium]MBR2183252.1 hypothetical protein [Acidaminococcaceae bacterium]
MGYGGGKDKEQGFILLPLLLFLLVCSGIALAYMRTIVQELDTAKEFLHYRQLETVVQSFVKTALYQEDETVITDAVYHLEPLYPGKESVTLTVKVNREEALGMRFLQVDAVDSCDDAFSLRQCRIRFSDSLCQQFEQSCFIVLGSEIWEDQTEKSMASITGKTDGAVFPQFSVGNIAVWASTDFPSALELQRDGLSGWFYLSRDRLTLPARLAVNGDGILAFADNITIGDDSVFTGRIVLVADGNVHVGSRVRMENVLLLCKRTLTVGSDSFINGAVMVQQDAVIGKGTKIEGNREVLNQFDSIVSY